MSLAQESDVEINASIPTVVPLLNNQVVICHGFNRWPDRLDRSGRDASRSHGQGEGIRGLIYFEGAEKQVLDLGVV